MTKLRLVAFAVLFVLGGLRGDAALFGGEKKAYDSASQAFQLKLWERAEKEFANFLQEYPKSERATDALLLEAQAQYNQGKSAAVVELLQAHLSEAGAATDDFLYWIGAAQFKATNYAAAAQTYGRLAREFSTSPWRLEAAVAEADAIAKQGQWANVITLLRQSDAPFRLGAVTAPGSELVSRGFLLLAEAQLVTKDFPGAEVSLTRVGKDLPPDLEWQRRYLLCRVLAGSGRADQAAQESDGMIQAAQGAVQWGLLADSVVFRAELLEQLGRWSDALSTWQMNFSNAPVARQRQALTRATALAIRQNQLDEATRILDLYLQLNQYTNAPADVAWLTLGELHLKQAVAATPANQAPAPRTNQLAVAEDCLQRVVKGFSGSTYIGKAQLGLGWCYWVQNKFPESEAAFDAAVKRLPPSQDRAVALFKLADAQFVQGHYAAAQGHYQELLTQVTNWPAANEALRAPASYQALRASLALTNTAGAELAMREILASDPGSAEASGGLLVVAQAYVDSRQPSEAMRLFNDFARQFPDSVLRPEVDLLVAQLQEEQGDWTKAAATYDAWSEKFGTNQLRPKVDFHRALAAAGAGNETNALARMTNFIAQYPANPLAPQAQWWVADYYFSKEDFATAELNYKQLFQNWPASELAYQARLMAGRAAVGRSGYGDAIEHFKSLTGDTNCPPALWMQAMSAYGGALMRSPPAATSTNKLANFEEALRVLNLMVKTHPTNQLAAAAWGEIGNCALQLGDYTTASKAYQQAIAAPGANVTVRSAAKWGVASVLEKQAQRLANGEQAQLLALARDEYLDVYLGKILREGEAPDEFWRKKAGQEAARVSELLKDWPQAIELYGDMLRQNLLPRQWLEQKIESVEKLQNPANGGRVGANN